jgi:enoyl-CoA hydratase
MACPRVSKRKPDKAVKNFFMVVFFFKTKAKQGTFGVAPLPCFYFRGMKNELVLVDTQIRPGVALLRLNRPKELNALNLQLMAELRDALAILDKDENVRAMVLTGNEKAFAAGADIHQMSGKGAIDMLLIDQFATWEQIRRLKKPLIAAVSGFVLGGGNELVMHCDLVVASETARFGQPEILLGIMPGAGGTQRLTRQIGKVNAMEMVLTGQPVSAKQALAWGLVNRVVPVEVYLDEALRLASEIALRAPLAVRLAKESVLKAQDSNLSEGLEFERKNFYMLFASADQKEGMDAFVNKRPPQFTGT